MRKALAFVLATALTIGPAAGHAAQEQLGGVQGTAQDAAQQAVGNVTVNLRNVQTGQIVSSTTANAAGQFSFAGISPGSFLIEIVDAAGNILGTATVTVTAGAVATVAVTATALGVAAVAAGTAGGLAGLLTGTSLLAVTAATVAGFTLAIVATRPPASPSR